MRASMRRRAPDMRTHGELGGGRLANFYVVDDRQYRAHQVCPTKPGGSTVVAVEACKELLDPSRSLLGAAQEAWLERSMAASRAGWNILAQQTLIAQLVRRHPEGAR